MLLKRKRVMAAKIEATPGAAETLAAADAAMNIFNAEMKPEVEMEEREGAGSFTPLAAVAATRAGTCTFMTELVGGATLPKWATTFLPACGFVASGDVFSPKTEAPGANVKTLTIGIYEDGKLKQLRGAAGTAVFTLTAGKVIRIEWTFKGIWMDPVDAAILSPTYPVVSPLRFAASDITVGSWEPKINELKIDLGNEIVMREDAGDVSGFCHALITDRKVTGNINPESTRVATYNINDKWLNSTTQALSVSVGGSGNTAAFAAPALQFMNVQPGDRGKLLTDGVDFQLTRSASAGDDELTITL